MRAEWEDAQLVEPWARAMGERGDYWRQALINPLVLAVAERVAAGGRSLRALGVRAAAAGAGWARRREGAGDGGVRAPGGRARRGLAG